METASRFAIAIVLNAAWQVPLVALAAAAGGRLLASAAARHRLLLAVLAASVVLPVAGSVASSGARPSAEAGAASAPPGHAEGAVAGVSRLGRAPSRSLAPSPRVANGAGRARRKAGVFASVAAASLLATASALAATYAVAIEAGPDGAAAILGSWSGRFDDRSAAPAVDLTVVVKQGGLSGRVTFYEVDLQGGRVRGKDEVEMLEPRFDGRRLTFKVKNPDGEKLSMALRLTGDGEGDLIARRAAADGEPEKESHELVIKMKRLK